MFEFTLGFGNKPLESLSLLPHLIPTFTHAAPHSVSPHSERCWEVSNRVCQGRVTRITCGSCIKFDHTPTRVRMHTQFVCQRVGFTVPQSTFV